jgi:hypothetical protein
MGPIVLMWSGWAAAQEPPAPEASEASEEVVVWGELAKEKARDALVARMAALGWREVERNEDEIRFRADRAWKGTATFHSDGAFTFTRPVAGLQGKPASEYDTPLVSGPTLHQEEQMTLGAGPTFWLLPSSRKLATVRDDLVDGTHTEVEAFLAVSRRTTLENELVVLPDRLDALWAKGTPITGAGPVLPTQDARRRAVLEFWATRTDTPEGERVAEAVEAWLAAVVQSSQTPITEAERAEFDARRTDGRKLP